QEFAIVEVEDNQILKKETLVPPPHEPGVLPSWLHQLGTNVVIAGGMGQRAVSLFDEKGIKVVTGAPTLEPEELVNSYLNQTLQTGANVCDH
ncbi:MAG: NifB/NifX family molybdenum-iron cluster-binding protein, partial [Desulfobacterales bacterium]